MDSAVWAARYPTQGSLRSEDQHCKCRPPTAGAGPARCPSGGERMRMREDCLLAEHGFPMVAEEARALYRDVYARVIGSCIMASTSQATARFTAAEYTDGMRRVAREEASEAYDHYMATNGYVKRGERMSDDHTRIRCGGTRHPVTKLGGTRRVGSRPWTTPRR